MTKAEILFTETFTLWSNRFADISSFRRISQLGLPLGTAEIHDIYRDFAYDLFNDPVNEKFFIDKLKANMAVGGYENFGSMIAKHQLVNYNASIDAASLVFAHSIVDNAVLNYCICSSLANPTDWATFITKKNATIEDIIGFSKQEIINKKVADYIASLDRESLVKKAGLLFAVCQPPEDFAPIDNFEYDNDRLLQLDEMRHNIVHDSTAVPMLLNGDDDILFLQQTTFFYMALVNYKYDLKLNLSHIEHKSK
jgi:hypothetical protein